MNQLEKQAIELAVDQFYKALNILFTGDSRPMQEVWSHADDVVYMGPDALYLIGWAKISEMWVKTADMKLGGNVMPRDLHTIIGSDISMVTCVESGENEVQGNAQLVGIRSSTVFRKENSKWMVIAHQTDLLKFMN
jgi:ketosteroid isomerase-like protein